ncbi:MAG: Ig-like domain-containing protein, partial [Actinomycetota bacterium]
TLNRHDRLTRGHTERVRAYSVMIGEELGLEPAELELLNWSGLVHDVGKLAVPPEILNKPGKPDAEEWAILRNHPAAAEELVAPLRPWLGEWAESATQHHERFDGAGYPLGLAAHDITLAGRIVAVADAYDVMTSARSYKRPMPAQDARRELAINAGTQFDPVVVRAFLNVALGRLRLVMGPLTSVFQFPAGSASLGSAAATGAGAIASVAVATVLGAGGSTPPPELAFVPAPVTEEVVEEQPEDTVETFRVAEVDDTTVQLDEDGSTSLDLGPLAEGDIDSFAILDQPEGGTVRLEGSVLSFTPDADWNGSTEVRFRVCFVNWTCEVGTVDFVVEATNDPPTPWADRVSTVEDVPVAVDVVANDVDIDGDVLALTDASVLDDPNRELGPNEVTVSVVDGRLLVTPGSDQWGSATIDYEITDGIDQANGVLIVEATSANDPPIAVDDAVVAYENTSAEFAVLANDADVDGDPIAILSIEGVEGGTAVSNGETVTFVPDVRYVGPAGLTYTVTDGELTASARVDITVREISDRPALVDDAVSGIEDHSITIDVLANDDASPAQFDLATVSALTQPDNGTLTWDGATFSYQPDPDWSGQDGFAYAVCDTDLFCNTADVVITVDPVNDGPSFAAGAGLAVVEDSGVTLIPGWASSISPGPADEADQAVSFVVSVDDPSLFAVAPSIDAASGALSFELADDANGPVDLTVSLTDDG